MLKTDSKKQSNCLEDHKATASSIFVAMNIFCYFNITNHNTSTYTVEMDHFDSASCFVNGCFAGGRGEVDEDMITSAAMP